MLYAKMEKSAPGCTLAQGQAVFSIWENLLPRNVPSIDARPNTQIFGRVADFHTSPFGDNTDNEIQHLRERFVIKDADRDHFGLADV